MGIHDKSEKTTLSIRGVQVFKDLLAPADQSQIVADIRDVVVAAPLFSPTTAFGRKMSVRMTSAGKYGWFSDSKGYRYERLHPNGGAWPNIPNSVTSVWRQVTQLDRMPDCCLINFYADGARMGMHQDKDEADYSWPVVSISLGDQALFRIGNIERGGPTESIWLHSGDVVVLGGPSRLRYHGIDRTKPDSSELLAKGGRINLTMRVVD